MEYVHRRDLISPERLAQLRRRDDRRAWLQIGSHFGAVAASGAALYLALGTWWAVPAFVIHGMLINYLYAAQHELMHGTVFNARFLNEMFSRITGLLVLYPRDYDRSMHFEHHRHTNVLHKDPELMGLDANEMPDSWGRFLWRLTAIPYWTRRLATLSRNACGYTRAERYMSNGERTAIVREARLHVVVYAAVAAVSVWQSSSLALVLWLAPVLITKPLHHVQNIVEHTGLPLGHDVLATTRTIHVNPVLRWMAWNMQYHCEHHLFAAVPFYNLPALHRELSAHLRHEVRGYLGAARDVVASSRATACPAST